MKISDIPFFELIDENILDTVELNIKSYNKNETIYNQNDICNSMDIVLSGSLVAYSLSQNGSENIVFDFTENSVIGANLLFGNSHKYPMNIYCTENCKLLHIKKSDVENLLHNYNFAMNFIKSISLNSQGINKKIAIYAQNTLRENLITYFLALSSEQKSKTIKLPISKKQLSNYFGVQRPSLFRELKIMKNQGIIIVKNRTITLCNDLHELQQKI